jgi:hypothetical protein
MKRHYNQEVSKWLKANPGRTVTQYQITSLFSTAYGKAATLQMLEVVSGKLAYGQLTEIQAI